MHQLLKASRVSMVCAVFNNNEVAADKVGFRT